MGLYEHPDVVQWGINLFDSDPAYSPGYYSDIIQHDTGDVYNGQYYHSHYDTESNQIQNDEFIARALQEEFSRLDMAECSGYSQTDEEQFHASEPTYDWNNTSMMNYCSGHDYAYNGVGEIEPSSSSCCSPCEIEESSLELTDNYPLDGEIGRRLSQMVPIPHVPKINGEIPSIDKATSDHQRLLDRLQLYDFVEHMVQGDGNCQFRALSDQLYNTPDHHKYVRRQVVNKLKSHPEIYEGYVPMEYGKYLEKMTKSGEWGDHVTLQAAADLYGVRIFVMTSFKDTCCIEILPHFEKPKGVFGQRCITTPSILKEIYRQVSRERRKGGGTLGLSINSVADREPEHTQKFGASAFWRLYQNSSKSHPTANKDAFNLAGMPNL